MKDHTEGHLCMINIWKGGLWLLLFIAFFLRIPSTSNANSLSPHSKSAHLGVRKAVIKTSSRFFAQDSVIIDTANTGGGYNCQGTNDNKLVIQAYSTTGSTLHYSIDSGKTFFLQNIFSHISSGIYKIVVKDDLGNSAYYAANVGDLSKVFASTSSAYNCVGSKVQLNINAIGVDSYSWSGPNGFISGLKSPILNNVQPTDSGLYSVTIAYGDCYATFSVFLRVSNPPIIYNVSGSGTYCGKGFVFLDGADSAISYQLLLNGHKYGTPYLSEGENGYIFDISQSGNYTIQATNTQTGCTSLMNGTANITINPNPQIFAVSGAGEFCLKDTLKLVNSETGVNYQLATLNPKVHGIQGQYYANTTFTGTPTANRVDSTLNFADLTQPGVLPSGIPGTQYFSVRWSGFVKAPVTGAYTFSSESDDGIRVALDGKIIIDDFQIHADSIDYSSSINLVAGKYYFITVDYYQATGGAIAQLRWSYPGQALEIIPPSQWYLPNSYSPTGSIIAGTGSSIQFPIAQSGNYLIVANGTNGNCGPVFMGGADSIIIDQPPTTSNAGGNQTLCLGVPFVLSGNSPAVGTGLWSEVSGPNSASFINPYSYTTVVNGLVAGVYVFQWTITNGACTSQSQVTITITAKPDNSNAGLPQTLCNVSSTNLAGNNPVSGTGTWTQVSGASASTITNPNAYNTSVTGLIPGNYIFQWSISSGSCVSSTSTVNITVDPGPTPSNAGASQNLCNVNSTTLAGNNPLVGTGIWTLISGPNTPVISNPALYNTSLTGLIPGTYILQWTISNSTCAASSSNVQIIVSPPPTNSNAGPTLKECSNLLQFQLGGNTPSVGTGTWTEISGPNSLVFANPNSGQTNVTGFQIGTYVLNWTISNGSCSSSSIDTLIIVSPPSPAVAGPNQYLCNVSVASLSANPLTIGTGTWIQTSGAPSTIVSPNSINTAVTGLSPGVYSYRWQVSIPSGACTSEDSLKINVYPTPDISNAGANQNLCNVSSATLSANNPVHGSGYWTFVSGPNLPNLTNPAQYNSTVTGMIVGTYVFQWTVSSGICSPSTSQVVLVNSPSPDPSNAGPNQNLCNVSTAILAGNNPVNGTGLWTLISGPNIPSITNPTSYNSGITGMILGTYRFQWTISNGTCTPSTSTVTLINSPLPSMANAGANLNLCNATTTSLSGNVPTVGIGTWSFVSGPSIPNFANPNSPTTSISGLIPGNYTLNWTISSGSCTSSTSSLSIFNAAPPSSSNAGSNQSLCNTSNTLLAGNNPSVGTGTWTLISGPNSPTIVSPNTYNSAVTGMVPGLYTFGWTITNGNCTATSSTVSVLNSALPDLSNAGPNQNLCNVNSILLAGNSPTNGTGIWSLVSGPNSPIIQSPNAYNSLVSGLIPGSYVFQWTISNGNCAASISTVSIINSPIPTVADAGANQFLCNPSITNSLSTNLSGNTPINGIGVWNQISGLSSTIIHPNSPNATITGLTNGTYTYLWTISSGNCISSSALVSIQVSVSPSPSNAGPNQSVCNASTATLAGNTPIIGSGLWTQVSGPPSIISNPNLPNTSINGLSPGNYVFQWSISNGSCINSSSQMSLQVSPLPSISNAGPNQTLCNTQTLTLSGNVPGSGTGLWTLLSGPNNPQIVNPSSPNTAISGLISGQYVFEWTISSGSCTSSSSTVNISISDSLKARISQVNNLSCKGSTKGSATVSVSGGVPGYHYLWNTIPAQITPTASNLDSGTYICTITDNLGCTTSISVKITQSSPVILVIHNPPPVSPPFVVDLTKASITAGSSAGLTFTYFTDSLGAIPLQINPQGISISGVYYIKGTNDSGCYLIKPVIVTINPIVLPIPVSDSGITQVGKSITLSNITQNDIAGTYPIDPSSIDLDPGQPGIQSQFTLPGEGFFSVSSLGTLVFFPSKNYSGIVSIIYTVADKFGNRSSIAAGIIIKVNPVANNDTLTMAWNTTKLINELSNDLGRLNPTTVQIVQNPAHGTLSLNSLNGQITYIPDLNYSGKDSLLYSICDSTLPTALCTNSAKILINVYSIADLGLVKKAPARVDNDVFKYTLVVTNYGPGNATQIKVSDTLPKDMVFVTSNKDHPDYNSTNNVLTWNIPSLASGQTDSIDITVNTPDLGLITNTAQVTAHEVDLNLSNNISSVTINKIGEVLFFPTYFTPNGDGVNDNFVIRGLEDYPENEIFIFNRWGNEVYHASTYMRGGRVWSGSNLSDGTYFYILNVVINGASQRYNGYITVIRGKR